MKLAKWLLSGLLLAELAQAQVTRPISLPLNRLTLGEDGFCVRNALRSWIFVWTDRLQDTVFGIYQGQRTSFLAEDSSTIFVGVDSIRGRGASREALTYISSKVSDSSLWIRRYDQLLRPQGASIVPNGGFDSSQGWGWFANDASTCSIAGGLATIQLGDPLGTNVQLWRTGIQLRRGATYRLTYRIRALGLGRFEIFLQKHTAPYVNLGLSLRDSLLDTWTRKTHVFSSRDLLDSLSDPADTRLRFAFDGFRSPGIRFEIDSIAIVDTLTEDAVWREERTSDSTFRAEKWLSYSRPREGWGQTWTISLPRDKVLCLWLEKVLGDPTKNGGKDQQARLRYRYNDAITQRLFEWVEGSSPYPPPY